MSEPTTATNDKNEKINEAKEDDDEDLEKLQAEIAKMEEEAARIAAETANLEKEKAQQDGSSSAVATAAAVGGTAGNGQNNDATGKNGSNVASADNGGDSVIATEARDKLSIYVGQVDYSSTPEELLAHFEPCGTVERVTICCDKFTGQPKGFAYLEFQSDEAVGNALKLDGSEFKGRKLKVTHKRVNDPFFYQQQQQGGGGRGYRGGGRGFRGRGRGRGGGRGRGRGGYRGGFNGYHPYY